MIFLFLFSFLLEHAFSMCISLSSYFHPLFCLVTLVVVTPYFTNRKKEYFLFSFFLGLFYDIAYTNTVYLHAFLFLLMAFFLTLSHRFFQDNLFSSFLRLFFSICIYQLLSFLLLCVIGYFPFHLTALFMGIIHCLFVNLFYGIFLFLLLKQMDKKFSLKN